METHLDEVEENIEPFFDGLIEIIVERESFDTLTQTLHTFLHSFFTGIFTPIVTYIFSVTVRMIAVHLNLGDETLGQYCFTQDPQKGENS